MTLLDALTARPRIRTRQIWDTESLDVATHAVRTAFPDYERARTSTLEETVFRLEKCVATWEWEDIKVGDLALVVRAVYSGQTTVSAPATEFLRRELEVTSSAVFLQALCDLYMDIWQRGSQRTRWLAEVIKSRQTHLPSNWARCVEAIPGLLDSDAAPDVLAANMVEQGEAYGWLVQNGISAPHAGELMNLSHLEWLTALPDPVSESQIQNLFSWLSPPGQPTLEGQGAARTIEKLLQPWLSDNAPENLRLLILDFVVATYGDPRNQRADFWSLVSDRHRKVLMRWLAGQSMDALLAIITKSTANDMWPPRHRFWKGLYDRGLVSEAWVALSPAASDDAEDMFKRTNDAIYTMSSRQVARSRKDTSLLIMRIGQYTVLEGSHDYRLHVFHSDDPAAPRFYENEYDAENLTLETGHRDTKIHDPHGQWMKWAEQRLLG